MALFGSWHVGAFTTANAALTMSSITALQIGLGALATNAIGRRPFVAPAAVSVAWLGMASLQGGV